jgi:hypothetical protein
MNYAVEMGSVAMIYIPSCIKIGSASQELIRITKLKKKAARA